MTKLATRFVSWVLAGPFLHQNGRVWVFRASTADLGYRIVVTDTMTAADQEYWNEVGARPFAIMDTLAFQESCVKG